MDLATITFYFTKFGAIVIFVMVLLEYMNLPGFPAGVIMPLSGIMAANGNISFLQHAEDRDEAYRRMSQNAYKTAMQYRQEAVALQAVHYYNNLVAAKAANYKKIIYGRH